TKEFASEMREASAIVGRVKNFSWSFFCQHDELLQRSGAQRRRHRDDHGRLADQSDWREIAFKVHGQIWLRLRQYHESGGSRHVERVAVRLSRRGGLCGNEPRGAIAVDDRDLQRWVRRSATSRATTSGPLPAAVWMMID